MNDLKAAMGLIESGILVEFEIVNRVTDVSPDGENLYIQVDLQITCDDDADPESVVEWGAFGFIFVIATLSFEDARPRGYSAIDYENDDHFEVADFLEATILHRDGLKLSLDYVRGRSVKTDVTVAPDGLVSITTWGRGESLYRWLDRIKGKKTLSAVPTVDDQG